MRFPEITAKNLNGITYKLPRDLEGDINFLLVGFAIQHQELIDTWIPWAEKIEQKYEKFRYYEIPVAPRLDWIAQESINIGMKRSIRNFATQARTITIYDALPRVLEPLEIRDITTIYCFLCDKRGNIYQKVVGCRTEESEIQLTTNVRRLV